MPKHSFSMLRHSIQPIILPLTLKNFNAILGLFRKASSLPWKVELMGTKVVGFSVGRIQKQFQFFWSSVTFFSFLVTRHKDFAGMSLEWSAELALSVAVILRHLANHSKSKFCGSLIFNEQKHTLFTGTCNTVTIQKQHQSCQREKLTGSFPCSELEEYLCNRQTWGHNSFFSYTAESLLWHSGTFPLLYTEDPCSTRFLFYI